MNASMCMYGEDTKVRNRVLGAVRDCGKYPHYAFFQLYLKTVAQKFGRQPAIPVPMAQEKSQLIPIRISSVTPSSLQQCSNHSS